MAVGFGVPFFLAAFCLVRETVVVVTLPSQGEDVVTSGLSLPGDQVRHSPCGLYHGRSLKAVTWPGFMQSVSPQPHDKTQGGCSLPRLGARFGLGAAVGLAVPFHALLPLRQGPLEIGPGCLLSGLAADSSPALQGCPLHDIVLQGHHVRLRDLPCRVFTLTGRLDDWQVRGQ